MALRSAGGTEGEALFSPGIAVGDMRPYFLTQAAVHLDRSRPLDQQPGLTAIEDQALAAARVFAAFIGEATVSLDIAIYDFRLLPGPLTDQFAGAVRAAAERGVSIRLA